MESLLKEMLSSVVAIPYDDNLIELIGQGCQDYITNIKDCDIEVQQLSKAYILNQVYEPLLESIQGYLISQGNSFHLPRYVSSILAGYTMKKIIDGQDDEEYKSILSTIVMNQMVIIDKNDNILFQSVLRSLFKDHIYYYLEETDDIPILEDTDLIESSFDEDFDYNFSDSQKDELKMIFKEAELQRCMLRLKDENIQSINNVYKRIYCGLSNLLENMEVLSYKFDPLPFIKELINAKEKNSRKSISSIITLIGAENDDSILQSESSVLLGLIDGAFEKDPLNGFRKRQFTPLKFGVMLYYELYVEQYLTRTSHVGE